MSITSHNVQDIFYYYRGNLYWKISQGKAKPHKQAGWLCPNTGYLRVSYNKKQYSLHRVTWLFFYGQWPKGVIDHKNRIRHDNHIENLREATNKLNRRNTKTNFSSSKYNGITWNKQAKRWYAQGRSSNSKKIHIGTFSNERNAAFAWNLWCYINLTTIELEFTNLNR